MKTYIYLADFPSLVIDNKPPKKGVGFKEVEMAEVVFNELSNVLTRFEGVQCMLEEVVEDDLMTDDRKL